MIPMLSEQNNIILIYISQILTAQGSQLDQNMPDNTDIALNNGGFLHVVLDAMTVPDGNISEYIQNNANFSQLAHAIQVADISDVVFTGKLSSNETSFSHISVKLNSLTSISA